MTDAEMAEAFDRLAIIRQCLQMPWGECDQGAEMLRARRTDAGPRSHAMRTLHRLTQQAAVRTRSTYRWLGYGNANAYAAGETIRAHVLGTPAPRDTLKRVHAVGGWVADLAAMMLDEGAVGNVPAS